MPATQPNAAQLNIVMVEDHDLLREVLSEAMTGQGHDVRAVSSAEAFDDAIGTRSVDLLVLDLNLPGEDGLSLARRFRAVQPAAGLIVLSGRIAVGERLSAYAAGADIFLGKPVDPLELVAVVAALGRRLQSLPAPRLDGMPTEDSWHVDMRSLELRHGQRAAKLSHAEAALLVALARAPGQRLEAWQLIELLAPQADASKGALEVRLTRLRAKLRTCGAPPTALRALRNVGYQLCIRIQVD